MIKLFKHIHLESSLSNLKIKYIVLGILIAVIEELDFFDL